MCCRDGVFFVILELFVGLFFRADFEKNWQLLKRFFHALPIDGSCTAEASIVSTNVVSETLMTEEFIILTPLLNSSKTSQAEKTNCRCATVLPGASRNGRKPTEVGAEPVVLIGRGAVLEHFSMQRAVKIFPSVQLTGVSARLRSRTTSF